MTAFSEYIKLIITTGLYAFFCECISSYFSKSSALSNGLKLITGLCIFTVALSPIFSLINHSFALSPDFSTEINTTDTEKNLISLTETEIERKLLQQISVETGIKTEKISIEIECDNNCYDIKSVTAEVNDKKEIPIIKEFIKKYFGKDSGAEITVVQNEQH